MYDKQKTWKKLQYLLFNSLEKIAKYLKTFCYDGVDTIYTPCDNLQLSSRDLYAFFAKYLPFKRGTLLPSVYYIL